MPFFHKTASTPLLDDNLAYLPKSCGLFQHSRWSLKSFYIAPAEVAPFSIMFQVGCIYSPMTSGPDTASLARNKARIPSSFLGGYDPHCSIMSSVVVSPLVVSGTVCSVICLLKEEV